MKNKFLVLILVVTIVLLAAPTPALAFTGVAGDVEDVITGDPWGWGGYVYIVAVQSTGSIIAGEGSFSGSSYSILYSTPPNNGDDIYVYVFPNAGPEGTPPYVFAGPYEEVSIFSFPIPVETLVLQSGPNAVELVDFSVTSQSGSNTWLPFVLLIGSVALVGGAVTVIRKRRA